MNFDIILQGRGGHGSRPDLSHNPVDCFAAVFGGLCQIGAQISYVDGGTSTNIIPDSLRFKGTCDAAHMDALKRMVENTCRIYHCTPKFHNED